jgi:D-alanyl-lipoteichoic acid acyltransferase DltB (MBOAT superfamily)
MLFNSYEFIFLFMPVTLIGFFLLGRYGKGFGAGWLGLCSIFFYAWWDYRYVLLLGASIVGNYWFGCRIARNHGTSKGRILLGAAVTTNLLLLAYYKYADFFIGTINAVGGTSLPLLHVVLPIGISFFTFTQIAFLVDAYQGKASEYRFVYYVLFVTYFPHLIAGPVLHHKEMMPQFDMDRNYRARIRNFEIGLTIFTIGLCKKVLLADSLAEYANPVFSDSSPQSLLLAWGGVLAYTFQLYFDFSGYSDMAIGLSRLFGVKLPLNFNSPYKAVNIVEFWRRWHMTLSRFLRDYLYIPLGGNRHGTARRHLNLMITMLLGGLWHGAGWNFVIWGGLHGLYLVVNHAWSELTREFRPRSPSRAGRSAGVTLTFLAVTVAWVFFRSPDLPTAIGLLKGMAGIHGMELPAALVARLGFLQPLLESLGIGTFLGGTTRFVMTWGWVTLAAFIAFALPNTQEIMRRFAPALEDPRATMAPSLALARLTWAPRLGWAGVIGFLLAAGLVSLSRPTEFLYFQF